MLRLGLFCFNNAFFKFILRTPNSDFIVVVAILNPFVVHVTLHLSVIRGRRYWIAHECFFSLFSCPQFLSPPFTSNSLPILCISANVSSLWDNIHGVFAHCAGAKTSDGSKFKNATTAGVEHIDVRFYIATQINFWSYVCSVFNVICCVLNK